MYSNADESSATTPSHTPQILSLEQTVDRRSPRHSTILEGRPRSASRPMEPYRRLTHAARSPLRPSVDSDVAEDVSCSRWGLRAETAMMFRMGSVAVTGCHRHGRSPRRTPRRTLGSALCPDVRLSEAPCTKPTTAIGSAEGMQRSNASPLQAPSS